MQKRRSARRQLSLRKGILKTNGASEMRFNINSTDADSSSALASMFLPTNANTLNNTSMYSSSSSPEMRNRGIRTRSSRRVQEGTVAIPGSELCEADTDGSTDGVISRMTTRSKHLAKVTTAENETVLENELIRFAILLLVSRYRSGECSAAVVKQIEILAEGVKVKKSTIKSARYANKSVHLAIAFKKLLAVLNTDLYKHMIIDLICDRTVTLSEARRLNQELCYQLSRR
ncbi:hypothetical protein Tcan_15326 [Toxocara canis]|uniref:Uncharacterized protein n=1 Tax=Toxocara canis TaxID=6265 RepID=A0A0B2VI62_TOXCA|nr:hypothetical protein Tcan_15326 [Toxocara canis]